MKPSNPTIEQRKKWIMKKLWAVWTEIVSTLLFFFCVLSMFLSIWNIRHTEWFATGILFGFLYCITLVGRNFNDESDEGES